jgi:hypothetical protein
MGETVARIAVNNFDASSGGASRFFYTVADAIDAADPLYYCAKASRSEREAGLAGMPLHHGVGTMSGDADGSLLTGSGNPRDASARNPHPCVKPLDLCRYLATLLLPPAEYSPRRLLCPFSGVSSEMIGALLAGWDHVTGIEMDGEDQYIPIANARLHYWTGKTLRGRKVSEYKPMPLFAQVEE